MKSILNKLINKKTLSAKEAENVLVDITNGKYNNYQLVSFLTVFLMRQLTVDEFKGFREALLKQSLQVDLGDYETIDLVGTGGDGKDTFNISTLSSFVVAGAGYKVTKHGNYASSSVSGSSNVLEYLGYKFTNNQDVLKQQLEDANIAFLHAPLFHPALKNVAPVRKELGLKTIFNLLGPVVNPSRPKHQLLGVYSKEIGELYSDLLKDIDVNYNIVHSIDGYDEISLTSNFDLFTAGEYTEVTPEEIGFERAQQSELFGGDTVEKAGAIFKNIINGKGTKAQNNAVIANSAYAIKTISGKTLNESIDLAKDSLFNGKAKRSLELVTQH
ncbi:MAG: anthranilate phosphoribosyltransferase [Ichthyobacteriaceae bacterium]|nr:anthranilate phosphoribosyltransferase [Ichthyobacteriaceae bacterium]